MSISVDVPWWMLLAMAVAYVLYQRGFKPKKKPATRKPKLSKSQVLRKIKKAQATFPSSLSGRMISVDADTSKPESINDIQ
jgi:transposase